MKINKRNLLLLFIILSIVVPYRAICILRNHSKISGTKGDSLEIVHYGIHLDIMNFGQKEIGGYTEIRLTPKVNNFTKINLDLLKMTVDSVFSDNKRIGIFQYNDTLLQIPLAKALNINDTIKLKIHYHGKPQLDPSSGNWGGFIFSGNYAFNLGVGMASEPHSIGRFWYPCIDDFRSKSLYDYYIRTDKSHFAVCGGLLLSNGYNQDSTRTFHWHMSNKIPAYLASVAVSDYSVVKDVFKGIKGNITIEIYVNPDDTSKARKSFKNLKAILAYYEKQFGPYMWQRVGYVGVPFNGGAMEHATNITYPESAVDGTLNNEELYAHELSHHWFGDLVTCSTEGDMWLNEGWASFCGLIFREGIYGKQAYKDEVRSNHKYVLQSLHIIDKGYRAIQGVPSNYTYCRTVYDKGADVVHTLRGYMGDSQFFNTTKQFLNQYAYNNISTPEFLNFYSNNSGLKLNDFFDTWVYGKGFPHFEVDSFKEVSPYMPPAHNIMVYLRQRHKGTELYGNRNKLEITFMTNDWKTYTDTVTFSGEHGMKMFQVPFIPDFVITDKEEKVADATTDNYKVIKTKALFTFADTYFSLDVSNIKDSAFVRAEHNWVAPDKFKKPLKDISRISDYRYWRIDGIFPEGFKAKGKFYFSRATIPGSGYLDNTLLTDYRSSDSLLLLYRKNTADDWRVVPFTKSGSPTSGYIIAENIIPGEYCFGIGNPKLAVTKIDDEKNSFNVFPNPSENKFSIESNIEKNALIKIYDSGGSLVDTINIAKGHSIINWQHRNLKSGKYFFRLTGNDDKIIISRSVIIL